MTHQTVHPKILSSFSLAFPKSFYDFPQSPHGY